MVITRGTDSRFLYSTPTITFFQQNKNKFSTFPGKHKRFISVDIGAVVWHYAASRHHSQVTKAAEIHLVQFADVAFSPHNVRAFGACILRIAMGCTK